MQRGFFYRNSIQKSKTGNAARFLLPKFNPEIKNGQCSTFPFTEIQSRNQKRAMQRGFFYRNSIHKSKTGNAARFLLPKFNLEMKNGQCSAVSFTEIQSRNDKRAMQRGFFYRNSIQKSKTGNAARFLLPKFNPEMINGQCTIFINKNEKMTTS